MMFLQKMYKNHAKNLEKRQEIHRTYNVFSQQYLTKAYET